MVEPSIHAQICDLLGEDPDKSKTPRPTVAEARARCAPGRIVACQRGEQALILATLADGQTVTAPDRCPHDGGPLSDGFIEGNHLICSRHGWEFDLVSGQCIGRPPVRLEVRKE